MRHGSLFSGGGGFDLAAYWMGWENVFYCEWMPFPRKILKYYWPKAISYEDIRKTDFSIHRGTIDILTGGFPCQPYSTAGKRKGKEDERHLWPEMLRAIREIQPRWVLGENVHGLVNWSGGLVFHEVQIDLETEGYKILPVILPACSVNAPHRRDRIWFIAFKDTNKDGWGGNKRKKESKERKQWDSCSGNHERISTDNEKTWIAPNSTGNRWEWEWENDEVEKGQQESGISGELERRSERFCYDGTAPNSKSEQSEWMRFEQRKFSQSKQGEFRRNCGQVDSKWDAPNSCDKGLQRSKFIGSFDKKRQKEWEQPSRSITELYQITNWDQFPTQSPICFGDDGISSKLDSDAILDGKKPRTDRQTFNKWRSESIKMAGNAIAPQVALQIFKTIEAYERQYIQNS